jgi:hypothetical protein
MPHPYTQVELDAMDHPYHLGVCAHCKPVDPDNPTQAEIDLRYACTHCPGMGLFHALWYDNAEVAHCDGCGDDTIKAFKGRGGSRGIPPQPETDFMLCQNCRIQEHHDHCRDTDGVSPCPHGWAAGA